MDIAGVSTALANVSLNSDASIAVLNKAMDANESIGAGMVKMIDAAAMEQSVNPYVGSNLDLSI